MIFNSKTFGEKLHERLTIHPENEPALDIYRDNLASLVSKNVPDVCSYLDQTASRDDVLVIADAIDEILQKTGKSAFIDAYRNSLHRLLTEQQCKVFEDSLNDAISWYL